MRSRRSAIATALLLVCSIAPAATPVLADQEALCGDIQLIHTRGTGDEPDDAFFNRANQQLSDRLNIPAVSYSTYQVGKLGGYGGFEYPAEPQEGQEVQFLLEASFSASQVYEQSRDEGVDEIVAYLTHRVTQCPGELYVLTGHSQGADVTGRALAQLPASVLNRIAFAALFGDPRFQTYNVQVTFVIDQCYFPRPAWQRGTSECFSHGWLADDFAPYLPDALLDRAGSWCRDGDVACTGIPQDILTGEEHTKYHTDGDVDMAMAEAATHLAAMDPSMADDIDLSMLQFATGSAGADLAFVFDTTGSMAGEIADVAAQATALANMWLDLSPNGRVALVEFRDQGDSFVSRLDLQLTDDSAAFQTAIDALEADEGGDTPEAQLSGLMTALNELDWQDGATKVAIVITDAPGKDPEPITSFTRPQVSQRALEIDPVAIYGVDVINNAGVSAFMQPLSADTAGEVVALQPGQSLSDLLGGMLETVALNPVASLHGPYFADTGDPVHFTAAGSFDPDGQIVSYGWDFDGNGSTDQTTSGPTVEHLYAGSFSGIAAVRVQAADGGEALASAQVTVQSGGLTPVAPVTPASASATVTGPGAVSITWTPASGDHADGYTIQLNNSVLYRYVEAGSGNAITISGLDLSEPRTFSVRSANQYGQSPPAVTSAVGVSGWDMATRVNDDVTTTMQVYPDVALSTNGSAVAVWQDYRNTPSIDVYASRRDPTSGAWSANARANDVATGDQYKPAVAMDANGNAYAVWVDTRNGRNDIYFSKRSATTGVWSANVRVNSTTSFNSQDSPAIAIGPSGNAVAIWYRVANNKQNVWSARLAAGASTWGAEIRVTSDQALQKQAPAVTVAPDGTAHAVWMQPATGNADIYYSTLASGSSTWTTNTKVSDDPGTAFQSVPDIAVDGTGKVFVAWTDRRATPYQLRVRIKSGASWQPSTVVAADGGEVPSIAARTDGRAYVAWHDGDLLTEYPIVRGSMFDPATGTWSTPERIDTNDATHGGRNPSVVLDGTRLLVLWDNGLSEPSGDNNNDIYARFRAP